MQFLFSSEIQLTIHLVELRQNIRIQQQIHLNMINGIR